jgi:hypothetical protein
MRRIAISIFLFMACAGVFTTLGGCGDDSQSISPTPSEKQVSKEKMKPTPGKPK